MFASMKKVLLIAVLEVLVAGAQLESSAQMETTRNSTRKQTILGRRKPTEETKELEEKVNQTVEDTVLMEEVESKLRKMYPNEKLLTLPKSLKKLLTQKSKRGDGFYVQQILKDGDLKKFSVTELKDVKQDLEIPQWMKTLISKHGHFKSKEIVDAFIKDATNTGKDVDTIVSDLILYPYAVLENDTTTRDAVKEYIQQSIAAKAKQNTSATPGMSWDKTRERWQVNWMVDGKKQHELFIAKHHNNDKDAAYRAAKAWQDEHMVFRDKKWRQRQR